MNPILNGLFICDSSSEGHAVFTGNGQTIILDGPLADHATKGEQYEITITYIGDKPPHP